MWAADGKFCHEVNCSASRGLPSDAEQLSWVTGLSICTKQPLWVLFLANSSLVNCIEAWICIRLSILCRAEITTFFSDVNLCVWGKRVDSRPWVNTALVSSAMFSKCFACLVGPNKNICVFRVSTPKKLGRVGRDFFLINAVFSV